MPEVLVVDYGAGNILSVARALTHIGLDVKLSSDAREVQNARFLVLPGVGAFGSAVSRLHQERLFDAVQAFNGSKLLGICLGMQMLFNDSDEAPGISGLGLIEGRVRPVFHGFEGHVYPSVGWFKTSTKDSPEDSGSFYYFTHTYACFPALDTDLVTTYSVKGVPHVAEVVRGNIQGCQFHPEKSGLAGLNYLAKAFSLS